LKASDEHEYIVSKSRSEYQTFDLKSHAKQESVASKFSDED
jgi:hypothetical protein